MELTAARRSFLCDIGFWADRTPLHEAASHGRALQLQQLIEDGASVNTVTVDNITPLHDACTKAQPNCARLLLEAGAQVDVRTIHGSTPLCNACASGSLECAKLLLDYGAKVNPSLTALTASPLHEACIQGNVKVVRLMIASGAQLEAYDVHFGPPLHVACVKGHVDCVRELLNAGQQEDYRSEKEKSPRKMTLEELRWCNDWVSLPQILLLQGANVNSVKFHETALHNAARVQMVDMIELLVAFGANVYATDNLGRKPIDYTTPMSLCYSCLRFYETNPLSLQQLCRITVRRTLATRASKVVGQLNISHRIQSYLQYCDHPTLLE
ncbi:ankyrin repeat and SOCS box protein 13a.1 isoform X2 [Channa argus]|uniref:ankyrin repeat and SOCS box protein 13a.1 isoform X2 n=1 Tax=Channa argus TaxID=215402 RepID=UPI003521BA07